MYISTDLETIVDKMHHSLNHTCVRDIDLDMIALKIGFQVTYGGRYTFVDGAVMNIHHATWAEAFYAFAHELCHLLMDNGLQWFFPDLYAEYTEMKSNLFAAYFCVPTFLLKQYALPRDMKQAAEIVADEFTVPYDVALKRVEQYRMRKYQAMGLI